MFFCPTKTPFTQKALVWKWKLPGSSKGISWFPAGNSRCPRCHSCCSVHMLISPKTWPGLLSSSSFSEGERLNYFHARRTQPCTFEPSHCKALISLPFESPASLEFLQKTCRPTRPKDVQRCHNSQALDIKSILITLFITFHSFAA